MQAATYEATNTTNFKPRDKEMLAKTTYDKVPVSEPFRRAIVDFHRKEAPGAIVVDSDNHYLYYVLKDGRRSLRITVGRKPWPGRASPRSAANRVAGLASDKRRDFRLGVPTYVAPGPDNPMGSARALSLLGRQGHAVPHPRHQPARIYRRLDLLQAASA